jgi:hypothetical protein
MPFQKPGLDGLALAFEIVGRAKAVVGPHSWPGLARPNWARLGSAHGLKPGQEQPYPCWQDVYREPWPLGLFFRFSVGGLTGVAEIKGHRRTGMSASLYSFSHY